MEELLEITKQIKDSLKEDRRTNMTEKHFHLQMMNFVVGNAFDVFRESNTVTRGTVKSSEKRRLKIA